ncbi:transketolase family protein [Iodobacter ciconiae]|uniref:Transketolase n=1 Tax=Iodobacter ciconiae TaxID=2496266 RepID=A0A3S8ZWN1_9NEIS|nr:transketolase C-terminal domain-containing protein [Iodobacter ciconiae]AZN37858.1 transketolase [Iodobacter ciconiae]
MRAAFSDALVAAAKANPKVLLLTGDHGYALFDVFRKECPQQYINCGIAEQNMVGVAAGLAKAGFIPFVYGLSAFVPIRVLEQIKIDVCYESLKVIFIGDGAGVVYSHLGSSHQSTEDIAALRAIPNINILSPADRFELSNSMALALASEQATYLRMGKADLGDIHTGPTNSSMGALVPVVINQLADILILATGSMVGVANQIAGENKNIDLYSVPSIKPIDVKSVLDICTGRKKIFVLEEHSKYGGLGSCIAEIIAGKVLCDFKTIGIDDRFSELCGDYAYLMEEHGLNMDKLDKLIV